MDFELEQVVDDWKFIRQNTLAFIEALSNEDLVRQLPRPGIDTFMKHFEEMCDVQKAYLDACVSGEMGFEGVKENDEYTGMTSKQEIIEKLSEQDNRIADIVKNYPTSKIVWDEDDVKTLNSQLRNLCVHETLHIGQLIAFAYVMGIRIPEFVVESWSLSETD